MQWPVVKGWRQKAGTCLLRFPQARTAGLRGERATCRLQLGPCLRSLLLTATALRLELQQQPERLLSPANDRRTKRAAGGAAPRNFVLRAAAHAAAGCAVGLRV